MENTQQAVNEQQVAKEATKVYITLTGRIQELYRQIWEADEKGENITRLHQEVTLLESIIGKK